MVKYKNLDVGGALLDTEQLENYLQKLAADQILKINSDSNTYPVPRVKENLEFIYDLYNFLSEDLKNKVPVHPAGEWILDNFYIIEKNAKVIIKNLTKKKYKNLIGIANGQNKGFARVYVLAKEIVSYTDGKIDGDNLERFLKSYQNKKTLSMEELWSIDIFLHIALIEKIRGICEKIYLSQMQKRKVENIISRLVEFKENSIFKVPKTYRLNLQENVESKYPFIEYMSYRLKRYGKKAYNYVEILEEQVNKMGSNIYDCINREHYDIAAKKISMGNSIISINALNRLNFIEIFNRTNGVEDILSKDPCGVYNVMDYKTKEYYRSQIEKIAKKTKISEIYIAKKCLELANKNYTENNQNEKKAHVGYYLINSGISELYACLYNKKIKKINLINRAAGYIKVSSIIAIILCSIIGLYINKKTDNFVISFIAFLFLIIPIKNILIKIIQYVSGKFVKPKLIPKIDLYEGIPEKSATMVVIPTILKDTEKVKEIIKKLEVYYIANKSNNLYFTLLGDCSSEKTQSMPFDKEIVEAGIQECNKLNEKYPDIKFPKFNFIYRKRKLNNGEGCYLGWERKRGLLSQFNNYIIQKNNGNEDQNFKENCLANTFEGKEIPKIKYIITLDADTNLTLNTGLELVGAMSHILNKPELENGVVVNGYAIMQPRVGINLENVVKTNFTKLFSGLGGTDSYTNAISDFYFDNFDEGIFTGKGIYDLEIFTKTMEKQIPENTVLSHDLLEGSYARCGLATDIMLMDGYPKSYNAYRIRSHRWIRGDWQIIKWLFTGKLNILSKYKILDNINRSLTEFFAFLLLILNIFISSKIITFVAIFSIIMPYVLEIFNKILCKKHGEIYQRKFYKELTGYKAIFAKAIVELSLIPDKAYIAFNAAVKSVYRMLISKKHLLEWTTAEEAEQTAKTGFINQCKVMLPNIIFGISFLILGIYLKSITQIAIGFVWIISPYIMYKLSLPLINNNKYNELTSNDKKYVVDIGEKTWKFFKDHINEKSNFLPPDNYQENRREKVVYRTSPTNIGLALLSVVASYDLGYEKIEPTIDLLSKMVYSIQSLPKWNGHLYNWYNIDNVSPLFPRYISSVDSGNFVGYLYVLKQFLVELVNNNQTDKDKCENLIKIVDKLINETDFSKLFDNKTGLFSIGYNLEENKLTDSYYDLLASEARQASIVAIAKKDVSAKHWKNLSRTLTTLNGYKGLISWSGTAFEYLMPTINIKRYPNSLLDESCKFMIMSQIEYAKKLGITWGISEAAFNIKDLNGNYQYKAFGIPWLGLKRGLAEDMVVSSYGTMLAINDMPGEVISNIKQLEKCGALNKYGLYESVDYTPSRVKKGEKCSVVKTYMAHHQGLILLSIDNLVNNKIFQKRFSANPEIEAVDILLQERMPDNVIITKEKKERVDKIKYEDYDYYCERIFDKKNSEIDEYNFISNNDYTILIDKNGNGYSKYKNKIINRFKSTDDIDEGIHFFIKDTKIKETWSATNLKNSINETRNKAVFYPDKSEFINEKNNIKTELTVLVAPEESVEIRSLNIKNMDKENKQLEISSVMEPVLSSQQQDYSHKAFNNLFLSYEMVDDILVVKRKAREDAKYTLFMATTLFAKDNDKIEFEIDKNKLLGRNNFGIPKLIKDSKLFSNSVQNTTNPMIAFRKTVEIEANDEQDVTLVISVSNDKEEAIKNALKYKNYENIERAIKLSKPQVEAKIQYLGISGKDVNLYQRIYSRILLNSRNANIQIDSNRIYKTADLWKYGISGDNPILAVFVKNIGEIDILKKLVKAFEYYQIQNMNIDLIIINEEPESYENYLQEYINEIIWNYKVSNTSRGIFLLNNLSKAEKDFIKVRANLTLYGGYGKIGIQLDEIDYDYLKFIRKIKYQKRIEINKLNDKKEQHSMEFDTKNLQYFNGYGGFNNNGKEYVINVNRNNKLPVAWSNIMANSKFGTVVNENMGGYTWYKNSRLNRITAWNNDNVRDVPSEIFYFVDMNNGATWTPTLTPIENDSEYNIKYGLGYAKYIHTYNDIEQSIDVFVPKEDAVKINIIHLKNLLPQKRKIKIIYYLKVAIDEDEIKSNRYIYLKKYENEIIAKNIINDEFRYSMYVSSSENIKSYTCNKNEFFGNGNIENPEGIKFDGFSNCKETNNGGILAVEIEVDMEALGSKEITFFFGTEDCEENCEGIAKKYGDVEICQNELNKVIEYWNNLIDRVVITTPEDQINIMSNGWIIYQTYCARILARTGFYQSGGAFGFRDQLQDVLSLKYFDPQITKNQIIKHSKHQFIEGDVLHWWHDDTSRGVRTKFSDDLLWLPYTVIDYINYTNDYDILNIETEYLEGPQLEEGMDERYDLYKESSSKDSIYKHCINAIEKSLAFGEHGIPKIGSGDWNDGFSNVGNKGRGESVWLGFFLYDILLKFGDLCQYMGDSEKEKRYADIAQILKDNLNKNCWDGNWYNRAFCDDGKVLGSSKNEECQIDGISQSWAVISGAGEKEKCVQAIKSLEDNLVDNNNGIIKLLNPPFEKSDLTPGYIKAYLPGTRENGGQYTHAAIWAIIAEAIMGNGDKAVDFYKMISPIEHSKTKEMADKYKIEPYVISADIYGYGNLLGQGGWSWYTGSASWYYICMIRYILGLNVNKGYLQINPSIPKEWKKYSIKYTFGETIYNINVFNPNEKNCGVQKIIYNGEVVEEKSIKLINNGMINEVNVIM